MDLHCCSGLWPEKKVFLFFFLLHFSLFFFEAFRDNKFKEFEKLPGTLGL
jgi:hypothetical protein